MKVLDVIDVARREQVAVSGRTSATYYTTPVEGWQERTPPPHYCWRYRLVIGCELFGPTEASDELAKRARRMLAHEIFGEVHNDLRHILEAIYEERGQYRAADDPILQQIYALLGKVRG